MSAVNIRSILAEEHDENETDWYPDLEDEDYHTDKTTVGSTSLRKILKPNGSLQQFYRHFFLGEQNEETKEQRLGKLVHKAVLEGGVFLKHYVVEPVFTGKTKDGKESTKSAEAKALRAEWLASQPKGAIITTQAEIDLITKTVEAILAHPDGKYLFKNGQSEIAGMFVDEETRIRCKIKPDFLSFDSSVLVDFKTTKSSQKFRFGSQAAEYRYDFQLYMYGYGVQMINGKFPEILVNVATEKTDVCEPGIFFYGPNDLLRAESDFRGALRDLRKAIDNNHWPWRQEKLEPIHYPSWFVNESVQMEEEDERRSEYEAAE